MTVLLGLAALVVTALCVPHQLNLDRATPAVGATIWLAALALRALTVLFVAVVLVWYLPATGLFTLVTRWCWHAVLPFVRDHLMLTGHTVGDVALVAPAFLLAASVVSVLYGVWVAAHRVQLLIRRSSVGRGPRDAVVLNDEAVLVAAAGLRRPQVVISAGALVTFDDEELTASIEHERGHIDRRHRYLLVLGEFLRALARPLPGTRRAVIELGYQLERDADRYCVSHTRRPAALASAICKSAASQLGPVPTSALNGGPVARRVRALLDERPGPSRREAQLLRLVACALSAMVLLSAAALPVAVAQGASAVYAPSAVRCPG